MIVEEDDCVGCPPELGCLEDSCPYKHSKHCYCDDCGEETSILYDFDGLELCADCVLVRVDKVEF